MAKPRTLTVYGGWLIHSMPQPYRNQVRAICAAPSATAVRRIGEAAGVKITYNHMRDYWSETGNILEVEVATATPETLLYQPTNGMHRNYRGIWLPWSWTWAAPDLSPDAGYAPTACTDCGTSIDECDEILFEAARGCCSACSHHDTHNDPINHPKHRARVAAAHARVRARRAAVPDRVRTRLARSSR